MTKPKNNKEATDNLMNAMVIKHMPRIKFHVVMLVGFSAFLMFFKDRFGFSNVADWPTETTKWEWLGVFVWAAQMGWIDQDIDEFWFPLPRAVFWGINLAGVPLAAYCVAQSPFLATYYFLENIGIWVSLKYDAPVWWAMGVAYLAFAVLSMFHLHPMFVGPNGEWDIAKHGYSWIAIASACFASTQGEFMEGFFGELDTKESFLVQGVKKLWTTFWALRAGTPFFYAALTLSGMLPPSVCMCWCFLPVAYETCKMIVYWYIQGTGSEVKIIDRVLSGLDDPDQKQK
jgi:hypothetical protein